MTDEIDRTAEALLWTLRRLARVDEPWRHNRADAIDEVTRALSAARAAEPPQPASVGGVDPAFTSHMPELLMRLHAQRYPAAANNPTTLGAVWIGESRTPPELLAEALAQPPHTCAVDNDCAGCKAIMTRLQAKPAEPPHPSTEELVATVCGALEVEDHVPGESSALAALSELERRLTVKA